MEPDAAEAIGPHLLAGERILWSGRPRDTSGLIRRAVLIVLVGVAALVFRAMPPDESLATQAQVNSIVLAAIVFALIAEAFVFHAYLATTSYGVTNLRVLIVSGLRSREPASVFLDRLNAAQIRLSRHGSNLEFRRPTDHVRRASYCPFTNPSIPPEILGGEQYRLVGLSDAGHVYQVILDAAEKLA
ncbi:MAG: hypothetical protein Q7S58_06045 [Candidatus Binatus sp.]|uniref:hypothetical protein n=1 Tax=Candidatus Binatus sp. TaxID=2811406 RepID=UPI00271F485B|nr:hypothetical protein [Candidatus Binatus sp.]MDO8431957.1 hypothetical protein [Candidatus Binatus sp.]